MVEYERIMPKISRLEAWELLGVHADTNIYIGRGEIVAFRTNLGYGRYDIAKLLGTSSRFGLTHEKVSLRFGEELRFSVCEELNDKSLIEELDKSAKKIRYLWNLLRRFGRIGIY